MINRFAVGRRLFLFSVVSLVFLFAVGGTGYWAAQQMSEIKNEIALNGTAIKDQLQADMKHDALRADAMSAQLAQISVIVGIAAVVALVLFLMSLLLSRSTYRELGGELGDAAIIARSIAAGDLAVSVDTARGHASSLSLAMESMRNNLVNLKTL